MTDSGLEHEIDYSTGLVVKGLGSALAQAWFSQGFARVLLAFGPMGSAKPQLGFSEAFRSPVGRLWWAIGRFSVACRTAIRGFRSAIDTQKVVPESITCSRPSLSQAGAGCS